MPTAAEIESMLKTIALRERSSATAFDDARSSLRGSMRDAGLSEDEIEDTIEAYESAVAPAFGQASAGRFVHPSAGNPMGSIGSQYPLGQSARQAYDAALRRKVGPEAFDKYTAALRLYRQTAATAQLFKDRAFDTLGAERFTRAVDEAAGLSELQEDVDDIFRTVNPAYSVQSLYPSPFGGDAAGDATFDPLRRVATIALDPVQARNDAFRAAFQTVTHLLTEDERAVLLDAVRKENPGLQDGDLMSAAASAFADDAAPTGRRRPAIGLKRALKPVRQAMARIANKARGRGFQTAEDVWSRVRAGAVAARDKTFEGEKAPSATADAVAHAAFKHALSQLSADELNKRLQNQHAAIAEVQKTRRNRRLMSMRGEAGTRKRRALQTELRSMLRARAMMEAEAATRHAVRTRDALADAGLSPDPGPAGPTPDGPDPSGPAGPLEDRLKAKGFDPARSANDNGAFHVAGQRQRFVVTERPVPSGGEQGKTRTYFTVDARPPGPGAVRLGMFATADDAVSYLSAMDAAQGPAADDLSRDTRDLLERVTVAATTLDRDPNADIATIRNSGLLDERLDEAIGKRNAHAYVYPLRNGDVVWEGPGGWQAGSLAAFEKAVTITPAAASRDALNVIREDPETAGSRTTAERPTPHPDTVQQSTGRIPLDVPAEQEMEALAAGAHYDEQRGKFYAPNDAAARRLRQWTPAATRPDVSPEPTAEQREAALVETYRAYDSDRLVEYLKRVERSLARREPEGGAHVETGASVSLAAEHQALATVLAERGVKIAASTALGSSNNGKSAPARPDREHPPARPRKASRGAEM